MRFVRAGSILDSVRLVLLVPVLAGLAQADSIATADGATDWFGRGITGVRDRGSMIRLSLRQPASVVGLHIRPDGSVSVVGNATVRPGEHWIRLPGVASEPPSLPRVDSQALQPCQPRIGRSPGPPGSVQGPVGSRACPVVTMLPTPDRAARGYRAPEFLLLVVSDSTFTNEDISQRLVTVRRFQLATVAHDLPEFLVGRRTAMWAGYLVRL